MGQLGNGNCVLSANPFRDFLSRRLESKRTVGHDAIANHLQRIGEIHQTLSKATCVPRILQHSCECGLSDMTCADDLLLQLSILVSRSVDLDQWIVKVS
jgi:hypothetical protein